MLRFKIIVSKNYGIKLILVGLISYFAKQIVVFIIVILKDSFNNFIKRAK